MKRYLPLLIFLIACTDTENETSNEHSSILSDSTDITQLDSIAEIDTIDDSVPSNQALVELLENPIDLVAYKKEWGTSNSSPSGLKEELFEVPDTVGMLYSYMLFNKLGRALPDHPSETDLFKGFEIMTYKYGTKGGDFYDTNEELIMIKCSLNNTTLEDLNWYGKSDIEIMDIYGVPQHNQDDCLIYTYQNKTITAHLTNDQVDWYKYVRLNKDIDLSSEIPGILLDY